MKPSLSRQLIEIVFLICLNYMHFNNVNQMRVYLRKRKMLKFTSTFTCTSPASSWMSGTLYYCFTIWGESIL